MRLHLEDRLQFARGRLAHLKPVHVAARHREYSMLFSADDDVGPSERLLDVALESAAHARQIALTDLALRLADPAWLTTWPGEHYRLLAALVRTLKPRMVIEIGTATGLSALAMLSELPSDGRIVTYDVVPWAEFPNSVLQPEDFADGRLTHQVHDLSDHAPGAHAERLQTADIIFVDAAKDGRQERRFLDLLEGTPFRGTPIAVFDDIRLWNMLAIWREVQRPKLDVTSLGHWSGTGLIDYASSQPPPPGSANRHPPSSSPAEGDQGTLD
jgi:predicted O-methyltransferase YrrM